MKLFRGLSAVASAAVAAYAVLAFVLINGSIVFTAWLAVPFALPLTTLFLARERYVRAVSAIAVACLWISGVALLLWGLVLDPGDVNHLVAIFLPLHQFVWLAVGFVLLWITSAVSLFGMSLCTFLSKIARRG